MPLIGSMLSLCVGSSLGKTLFPAVGAAGATGLRNGLSAALMVVVCRPWRWRLTTEQLRAAALYGGVLGCMNLSFYMALRTLPLGVAIAIEFTGPLGLAVLLSPRRRDLVWIVFAAVGVAALALPGASGRGLDAVGVVFALAAALCWALYILTGERVSRLLTPAQGVCLGLGVAALVTVPVAVAAAGQALFDPRALAVGFAVAILCSAIPYPLELVAMRRLPRHVFGVVLSVEPAIGALAALVIIGEHLDPQRWAAIGLVVVASAGITVTHAPSAPPP